MAYPELMSERMELLAVIHPDLHGPPQNTYFTPWFSMAKTARLLCQVICGDITATGTVDVDLWQATDVVGTGAKAIAAKAITQLTAAGGDGDDYCEINLRTEEMDAANSFDWVRVRMQCLVATSNACVVVMGETPRYAPVDQTNKTEVIA